MPERIQLRRTKGWRKPVGAVLVSRPSVFGNPAIIEPDNGGRHVWRVWAGDVGPLLGTAMTMAQARAIAVGHFSAWLESGHGIIRLGLDGEETFAYAVQHDALVARLPELRGLDLCCWCPLSDPCHADVLLEVANP